MSTAERDDHDHPRRWRRWLAVGVATIVVLAGLGYGWAGWIYADELLTPVASSGPDPDEVDPEAVHGLAYERVTYTSEIGEIPAWYVPVPEGDDTWAIFVHGRGASMRDGLDILPSLVEAGLPSLLIAYRNDVDAPSDRWYGLGDDEWRDVDGAVAYALERGAEDVVLVGASMGGAIVTNHVRRGEHADAVRALILDAPALDWDAILRGEAHDRGLPGWLVPGAQLMARVRAGIDFGQLDQISHADEFDLPILLIHGTDDDLVPIDSSRRFAEAVGPRAHLVAVPGAGHVGSAEVAPARYDAEVRSFLARVVD